MNLDLLIEMRKSNPELPVRFMLPTDMDDDYPYYSGVITQVEIDVVWNCAHAHRIIVGKGEIKEELYNQIDRILMRRGEYPDEDFESDEVTDARIDAKYDEMVLSQIINNEIIVTMGFQST